MSPVRLEREAPPAATAGCALILGIFLTAVGAFPIYMTVTHDEPGSRTLYYIIGGGFAAVGLLLVWSGIVQFLAMATPETAVETESATLRRGASVAFLFRQRGPVSMESLRANLVGEERWATRRPHQRGWQWHTKHLGTFNFLDQGAVEVGQVPFEVEATLDVPDDITPSRDPSGPDRRSITWKIEVWGKVRGRADFHHPFRVTVE